MGSVWVAEQQQPIRRKVAVKLVKAGMDSRQVLARFEAERQALAMMDHPHIAKVLDGGVTEQGRPYFVMELVKGVPFTAYCDQVKLSLKERLALFIPVCQAVQHAHHKGIVHRDLKPSNILVCLYDGKPVPKVIDFGLAKALHQPLTEQTLFTAHGQMVGTPLYMSPEQAEQNNLDVDTRTDIYSLGVLLYELLTGSTPLEREELKRAAYDEILRLIREVEPQRPSLRLSGSDSLPSIAAQRSIDPRELRRSLSGDLDWIVMKALDKERSRRYETATSLARDIERFLNEEAVEACPPSTAYRLRKFMKKHRPQVLAAGVILAALVVGIVGATWGLIRARIAEQAASNSETKTLLALAEVTEERDAKELARKETQAQMEKLEQQTYRLGLQTAWQALSTGELDAAQQILLSLPKSLRRWEWHWLFAETDNTLGTVKIPSGSRVLSHSNNGRYALLTHENAPTGPLTLMDATDGTILDRITLPHVERIHNSAVSSDGTRVAILAVNRSEPFSERESTLYLWDKAAKKLIWSHSSIPEKTGYQLGGLRVFISDDGRRVGVSSTTRSDDGSNEWELIRTFNEWNGHEIFDIESENCRHHVDVSGHCEMSPDGRFVISDWPKPRIADLSDLSTITVTDLPEGADVSTLSPISGDLKHVAFSIDGTWKLFDLQEQTIVHSLGRLEGMSRIEFYSKGALGIGLRDNELYCFAPRSEYVHSIFLGKVPSVVERLVVDEKSGSVFAYAPVAIRRYVLPKWRDRADLESLNYTQAVSPDGAIDAVLSNVHRSKPLDEVDKNVVFTSTLTFRRTDSMTALGVIAEGSGGGYFSKSGRLLAAVNDNGASLQVSLFDALSFRLLKAFSISKQEHRAPWNAAMFDCEESRLAIWSSDTFRVIDLDSGNVLWSRVFKETEYRGIHLLNLAGTELWVMHNGRIARIEITSDSQNTPIPNTRFAAAAVSWDKTRLATVADDLVTIRTFPQLGDAVSWRVPHAENIEIAWGQEDERLFVASDRTVSICDVAKGEVLLTIPKVSETSLHIPRTGLTAWLGVRRCSTIPFRERWARLQAASRAASEPAELAASRAYLLSVLRAADMNDKDSDQDEIVRRIVDDGSLSAVLKLNCLRMLNAAHHQRQSLIESNCGVKWRIIDAASKTERDPEHDLDKDVLLAWINLWQPRANYQNTSDRNGFAWDVVVAPARDAAKYAMALEFATEALGLSPENGLIMKTLGVAHYRVGEFQKAIDALKKSEHMLDKEDWQPANPIFVAMARFRLGDKAVAMELLQQLREEIAARKHQMSAEDTGFLKEAEALIESP